jgi:hypothetical protein
VRKITTSIAILLTAASSVRAELVWNDGQHHTVDSYIADSLSVSGYIRVDEPWRNTTVDILDDGDIGGNVSVGSLGIVNLAGGSIQGNFNSNADLGNINISEGTVLGNVEVTGFTSLYISSADIGGDVYYGISNEYFSITDSTIGGDITTVAVNSSNWNDMLISNTTINGMLKSFAAPKMTVSGSSLQTGIQASSLTYFSIVDSGITGDVIVDASAIIRIEGKDFEVDGVDFTYGGLSGFGSGRVTGFAHNGQLIDFDFSINDYAEIILVPEPTTLILFGLGSLALRRRLRA